MSWFRREPPPPPPPPPSKIPGWVSLLTPVIMAIILGLGAFIGNSFSETIKEVKAKVESVDKEKVDNQTLQLMLKNQEILIKQQKEEADRQREEDAKKFEAIQQTQSETLKRIETIQREKTARPVVVAPPANLSIGGKADAPASNSQSKGEALSPEEFEKYMSMEPDIRIKYKRYLQKIGKDVSGLPD